MQNFATISDPEFINLQPLEINPYMSSCDIKVLYTGENRNRTFISKAVATEMSKTLRGAPIVGWFKEEKEDFRDHGEQLVMDGDSVSFNCMTRPYGFVPPDAKVWFQKFKETNSFGEEIEREYLMTQGYLWTGQYEELNTAFEGRDFKNQSMEIEDVRGSWEANTAGMEFFIVNDANFSKLCILGDDVEPCFEGANVSISKSFSLEKDFSKNLYTMMKTYEKILEEGGNKVDENKELQATLEDTTVEDTPVAETEVVEETVSTEEFAKTEDEDDKSEDKSDDTEDDKDDDEEEPAKKASLETETIMESAEYKALEAKYTELETQYNALKEASAELEELRSFKRTIENERKDALINSFTWLEDEDKADVIANKETYTLDEIEAKLSVISVRKKAVFSFVEEEKNEPETLTFSLDEAVTKEEEVQKPDWIAFAQSL